MQHITGSTFEACPGETIAAGQWFVLDGPCQWGPFDHDELTEMLSVARRPVRLVDAR